MYNPPSVRLQGQQHRSDEVLWIDRYSLAMKRPSALGTHLVQKAWERHNAAVARS